MTVQELIELLADQPAAAQVLVPDAMHVVGYSTPDKVVFLSTHDFDFGGSPLGSVVIL